MVGRIAQIMKINLIVQIHISDNLQQQKQKLVQIAIDILRISDSKRAHLEKILHLFENPLV